MKEKELKTVRFNMRLTAALNNDLREAARAVGKSVSALVREGIDAVVRKALSNRQEDRQMEQGPSQTETEV